MKLTTDRYEASCSLFVTAELVVHSTTGDVNISATIEVVDGT